MQKINFTGIVLAGGRSSRMGTDKAFLSLGMGTFIENTVQALCDICSEVIVVTNQPEAYQHLGVKVVTDIIPQQGPLSGIHSGLVHSATAANFVIACDMPFWDRQLIMDMHNFAASFDVVVPEQDGYLQPLHAFYQKTCIQPIEAALHEKRHKITDFYTQVNVKYFNYHNYDHVSTEKAFFNVNTQGDFDEARRLLLKGRGERS